jgi:hypothetical protein
MTGSAYIIRGDTARAADRLEPLFKMDGGAA